MPKQLFLLAIIFSIAFTFTACDKDDPEIPNEEEVITNLNYTLVSTTGETIVLSFADLDGDGGDDPIISSGSLSANETYIGTLELLYDDGTEIESITAEIEEEDEEHQFFFQSTIDDLSFAYNDQDADGNPVGLSSTITTGNPGSGSLTVTLRHEPAKSASGVSDNDITNAGGETDIEVTFEIDVQ